MEHPTSRVIDTIAGVPLQECSDEQLVSLHLEGSSNEAFEILVRRYERELYAYLRRYLGDASLAEDVFQATFVSIHTRLDQFEKGRRFKPWLYAVATNKAIDFKRHAKRRASVSLDQAGRANDDRNGTSLANLLPSNALEPSEVAIQQEKANRVKAIVGELNEPTQTLLHLVYYQGLKYADVSEALGIPVGTVKSRVFNAMRKLNELWQRKYGDGFDA